MPGLDGHEKIVELERFEDVVAGRELRMQMLEREVQQLRERLRQLQQDHPGA